MRVSNTPVFLHYICFNNSVFLEKYCAVTSWGKNGETKSSKISQNICEHTLKKKTAQPRVQKESSVWK